ncbi:P63C domain-containing protein [Riemerella anatipestifer]|uniref:P63C domain-containing protein n=1 Tax=Riemerella anatipestifer TaxID=34085 RepID=UPI001BD98262|nr:P63C domain-containing protein [Riemerella anatipestifer]MBT0535841.1 P63C domain-containing protein [Riemerella anatipestifer]MDR7793427.1 P63C domain-containing protein [Riemerella anatipestifer]MDY3387024.1 P63C domain-containing protein [Riemerella anatipestifer]MDY3400798.1 P63C domain-containing protein [Riemerella anatipestifer]MDY3412540.1 P63C domain-containing protein [Riemerella anatipestifer]
MSKILKAIHKGELKIGDITMSCAVLEDGTRIIGENGINGHLGVSGGKNYKLRQKMVEKRGGPLPIFLASTALNPFIDKVFDESDLIPVKYKVGDNISVGYKAEILPKVCEVWLLARDEKTLQASQYPKAKNAEILLRGLAHIGITALVDEATGYQYEREKDALQIILKAYISEELLKWQKMFPDAFYYEIFRLNKWDFSVNGIKKRPGVIGRWTKELIYKQLPKNVLEELEKRTPKSDAGNYTARFFQSLTPDIGHPALTAQIYKVIGLMNISNNWEEFKSHFNRMVDRNNGQMEIDFDAVEKSIETEDKSNKN